jgi:hypothetical protein
MPTQFLARPHHLRLTTSQTLSSYQMFARARYLFEIGRPGAAPNDDRVLLRLIPADGFG